LEGRHYTQVVTPLYYSIHNIITSTLSPRRFTLHLFILYTITFCEPKISHRLTSKTVSIGPSNCGLRRIFYFLAWVYFLAWKCDSLVLCKNVYSTQLFVPELEDQTDESNRQADGK